MTVFYHGPTVLITDRLFAVREPAPRRFPIDELRNVYVTRGDLDPVGVIGANATAALAVVIAASWHFLHTPRALLTATVLVAGLSVISAVSFRRTPRVYELRATHGDLEVGLFRSSDPGNFAEVQRGLVLAFEARAGRLTRPAD